MPGRPASAGQRAAAEKGSADRKRGDILEDMRVGNVLLGAEPEAAKQTYRHVVKRTDSRKRDAVLDKGANFGLVATHQAIDPTAHQQNTIDAQVIDQAAIVLQHSSSG
jgi:hypothetical protein